MVIKKFQRSDESIILAGDFNKNLDICSSATARLCKDQGLVDIFASQYPDYPVFSTYIRGTKRINYYLLLHNILPLVTDVGYEPFHYHTTSDHCGLFLGLDTETLFKNATIALAAPLPYRDLRSKDYKSNNK
jgi:hypothetical protein